MIFKPNKNKSKQTGFTLVEMMVAVSIFVIVAFIVVSTLLTLSYSYKKAQKLRLLMDNLNFSIQSMSLSIREGINYNQGETTNVSTSFSFKPLDSWLTGENKTTCFSLYTRTDNSRGIKKCENSCPCSSSGQDIISQDIDITNLTFYRTNIDGPLQSVKIIIAGTAGKSEREKTNFLIQNTIAQRNINNAPDTTP